MKISRQFRLLEGIDQYAGSDKILLVLARDINNDLKLVMMPFSLVPERKPRSSVTDFNSAR